MFPERAVRALLRRTREFRCSGCPRMLVRPAWRSRPAGWFIVMPPHDGLLSNPLEWLICSERCGMLLFRARAEARFAAAVGNI